MKCSIEGKITRLPYVGTGDSEVLPWKQVLSKVEALMPMMQSRTNGGPLCKCPYARSYPEESLTNCVSYPSRDSSFKR